MINLSAITSPYERKARLYPALLLLLPVVLTAILVFHEAMSLLQSLAALFIAFGGAFLLSELARDGGKKIEPVLIERWGGLPSAAIFRHSDTRLEPITKARYHAKLSSIVAGTSAPSPDQEAQDPAAADAIYLAWSNYVRINTRDQKRYQLLFQENISYGFRRNLLGLRVLGITVSAMCTVATVVAMVVRYLTATSFDTGLVLALLANCSLLAVWIFYVREDWVRTPALGYAERLAEAVDTLNGKPAGKKAAPKGKPKAIE